ncbi:MAG TPA: nitrite reductase (NAD(P)H), partial [Cytophagales bacterium]|nr:nitrite reductase (NAD(P)H) [Cytophagales bacterium]
MTVSKSPRRVVVVGNGMVGFKFCEKLRTLDPDRHFQITVLGEEPRPAYDRVHLSEYFSGKSAEDLSMAPQDWYAQQDIDLQLGTLVTQIDRQQRTVTTQLGQQVQYDYLVLATGSAPFVPPIPGVEKDGVFVYRTLEDLEAIEAVGKKVSSAAVIGG